MPETAIVTRLHVGRVGAGRPVKSAAGSIESAGARRALRGEGADLCPVISEEVSDGLGSDKGGAVAHNDRQLPSFAQSPRNCA